MEFIELSVECPVEMSEILMAEFSDIGYDTMIEIDGGFKAYITDNQFERTTILEVIERYASSNISWSTSTIQRENWNSEWEKNYDPIVVEGRCIVKAVFHDIKERYPYEITINPKMSFGTGHHETTYQILDLQTSIDHSNKTVMDAGCGTGVLAIMAELRGAKKVEAFDIDDWCIDNSNENFGLNNCKNCTVKQGTINELHFEDPFDIIIANINKNVLINDMGKFASHLKKDGELILSGFYQNDLEDIKQCADSNNLAYTKHTSRNNWVAACFQKK